MNPRTCVGASARGRPRRFGTPSPERRGDPPGSPFRERYTSAEVAQALGVTWEQLRYAIEQGRLPECRERDGQGRRVWTAEEVERLVSEWNEPRSANK
ncbi:MAG: MerR family transcriptional regulator [Polyangiaceae bacterium]